MKQFMTVLKFEYTNIVKSKAYIILTVLLIAASFIGISIPSITKLFEGGAGSLINVETGDDRDKVLISDSLGVIDIARLQDALGDNWIITDKDEDGIKNEVAKVGGDNGAVMGIIVISPVTYKAILQNNLFGDNSLSDFSDFMRDAMINASLVERGIAQQDINDIFDVNVSYETVQVSNVDGNAEETNSSFLTRYIMAYALIFMLYFAIMFYGQMVTSSVIIEKSSKAMEMLITSAKPLNLMFGKIVGVGLAGLTQFLSLILVALFAFNINKSNIIDIDILSSFSSVPISVFVFAIIFFLLGYFLYASMFGAAASLCSRVEDSSTVVAPIMLIYVAGFIVAMFGLSTPESMMIKVMSYIPFFSPMAMFLRICMSKVSYIEIALSLLLLFGAILLIGYLAAKIYRIGVLMYGKPPKIKDIIRMIKLS